MNYESSTVFSFVDKLLDGELPSKSQVHLMSKHHDKMEERLSELKKLFMQYYPTTENNNELNAVLFDIYRCEEDLQIHCLVEDNIFVPAVRRLEHVNKINKPKKETVASVKELENSDSDLSKREKDIVSCVAKGFSNKEIADKLCLSVHTVTTHRRNIAHKLNIHTPAGLTIYAIVNKLVTLEEVNI
jgi:regulator of cell morphogenesis and NO signaling